MKFWSAWDGDNGYSELVVKKAWTCGMNMDLYVARQSKCSANPQDFQTIDFFDAVSMPVMLLHTLSIHLSNLFRFCFRVLAENEFDVTIEFLKCFGDVRMKEHCRSVVENSFRLGAGTIYNSLGHSGFIDSVAP